MHKSPITYFCFTEIADPLYRCWMLDNNKVVLTYPFTNVKITLDHGCQTSNDISEFRCLQCSLMYIILYECNRLRHLAHESIWRGKKSIPNGNGMAGTHHKYLGILNQFFLSIMFFFHWSFAISARCCFIFTRLVSSFPWMFFSNFWILIEDCNFCVFIFAMAGAQRLARANLHEFDQRNFRRLSRWR